MWILILALIKIFKTLRQTRSAPSLDEAVLFLTSEGYSVAPARVRCFEFSAALNRLGFRTDVFSFWSEIFHIEKFPTRLFLSIEQVFAAIRAYFMLVNKRHMVIYQQRPSYDLITSLSLHWINGSRLIFDIDDWIFEYFILFPFRFKHLVRYLSRFSATCVVASRHLQTRLEPSFARVEMVPTFVDADRFQPTGVKNSAEVVFGWNGTLFDGSKLDSVMIMVSAFKIACDQLKGSTQKVRLEIVGDGAYLPSLKKRIAEEFSAYPISILGWKNPQTMPEYLQTIDVGLYSVCLDTGYMNTFPWFEDFQKSKSPTKIFEYMACGLPIISTVDGESASFLNQGITGFLGKNSAELSKYFVALATDAKLRTKLGTSAREICVKEFSLDAAGIKLAHILKRDDTIRGP